MFPPRYTTGIILSIGVAVSLLASALSGSFVRQSSIGSVSDERRLAITPRSGAFSIWAVIYTLLLSSAVYVYVEPIALEPAVLLGIAEVLTGVWVPLFLANTKTSLVAAAAVLVAAATAATVSVFRIGPLSLAATQWTRTVAVSTSFALFAGWLCCAAVLSIGIALQVFDIATPQWILLLLTGVVCALSVAARNPVLALPCLWALAWQTRQTSITIIGMIVCVLSSLVALR